jgi:hypothetical protein
MPVVFKDYRKESRSNWGATVQPTQNLTLEQLNTGAILRIADATEAMAKNHQDLIDERDRYKQRFETAVEQRDTAYRRISALQGVITKLKKKAS